MTDPVRLIELDWPTFGTPAPPPPPSAAALGARIDALRARMAARDLTYVVLFADREHFANLAWLTNFDPRFEEAVLVVGTSGPPLLLVGNECAGYVGISALDAAGALRHELFQPLSLVSQPRGQSRLLREILGDEGISDGANVGAVGWKYLRDAEHPDARHALDVPSWIADTLRDLAGHDRVVNATDLFIDPADGLRTVASVDDIAAFEHANVVAADGMRAMLFGLEEGMTDFEAMALAGLNGMPLGCHPTFATGPSRHLGLKSPSGEVLRRGAPMSANLCTWRANICRAGWLVDGPAELPDEARDYVKAFAGPYFAAMAEWFGLMKIGTPGGTIQALIDERLPFDTFGIGLNPGHLIDLDEWTSSPIYPGSDLPIRSGMVIQVDVIPSSPRYFSTRMEDGIAILDAAARDDLKARHPEVHARCTARRAFMQDTLGIALPDEVLPLSNMPAIVPPFFLDPRQVFALA